MSDTPPDHSVEDPLNGAGFENDAGQYGTAIPGYTYESDFLFTLPDTGRVGRSGPQGLGSNPIEFSDAVNDQIRYYFGDVIDNWELILYGLDVWDIESLEGDSGIPLELRDLVLKLEWINRSLLTTNDGQSLLGAAQDNFPRLQEVLNKYGQWREKQLSGIEKILESDTRGFEEKLSDLFSKPDEERFTVATDFITTNQDTVTQIIRDNTRENVAPRTTLPYELSIGLSKFAVPPLNVDLSSDYKVTSITGGAIRQPNSPKFNTGHSETYINVTLYFPNHDSIWGYEGEGEFDIDFDNDPENVIDYYMSSLRGLITAFKFSPFLPIKNQFLNSTFGITGVGLHSMTVQSLEGFPFVLAVNLTLVKFNHKAMLPMIKDFNQAIHWGKYRQYCGKAAMALGRRVEKGFLLAPDMDDIKRYYDGVNIENVDPFVADDFMFDESGNAYQLDLDKPPSYQYNNLMSKVQKGTFDDLRHFQLYYPKNVVSKIYAPDMSGFRTPYEDLLISFDEGSTLWDRFVSNVAKIDIENFFGVGDSPTYQDVVLDSKSKKADEGKMSDIEKIFAWLDTVDRIQNDTATGELFNEYFEYYVEQENLNEESILNEKINVQRDWLTVLLFQFQETPYIKEIIQNVSGIKDDSFFKEWEVPMEKMELDWDRVHINGISLSMGNNIVRHQLQMQEDPVHQHIGGRDTQINVSMIITGEEQLISFRRTLSHINGLARLEHAKGVIGFLGIKNTITALCGVKYVLPLSFEVNTIPGYPHVYQVNMTLVDFDIFQQKREILNSDQQKQLIEMFGKRNPFLRIKQYWGATNNYPDLPLEILNTDGNVVGYHDPDYYFRAFQTLDDDLAAFEEENIVTDNTENNTYDELLAASGLGPTGIENILSEGESALLATEDVYERFTVKTNLGAYDEEQKNQFFIDVKGSLIDMYEQDTVTGIRYNQISDMSFSDDVAEDNARLVQPGQIPYGDYQSGYTSRDLATKLLSSSSSSSSSDYEASQFESIMKDAQYRGTTGGRMLKAFPTYMLWLIDEGGSFAGTRLFDNFYGLNSVIDFSVVQSEDILGDTLVLRLSNMYQKLSREAQNFLSYNSEDDVSSGILGIDNLRNEAVNRWRHMVDDPPLFYQDLNNIRLKPGVRLHLRAGYGSNPNSLDTIFNGIVTEVQQGDIVTVIAQSDAIELSAYVNTENEDGHSGKIDGAMSTGLFLSEPRDLMVKLLTMGTSTFREQIARATRGVIFSESKYGIRHFGSILYEPLNEREERLQEQRIKAVADGLEVGGTSAGWTDIAAGVSALAGAPDPDQLTGVEDAFGSVFVNSSLVDLSKTMWVNLFRSRDYEIFKRNIYPGNGTGIMQFAGIDTLDAAAIFSGIRKARQSGNRALPGDVEVSYIRALANADESILDKGLTWQDLLDSGLSLPNAAKAQYQFGIPYEVDQGISYDPNSSQNRLPDDFFTNRGAYEDERNAAELADEVNSGDGSVRGGLFSTWKLGADTLINIFRGPYSRGSYHPFFDLFGLTSELDDDLYGFDEISFRAQTYMRTIWDLCKICADMQPNYIVAVRPFEDRSTLFYGKPHWLYTSGVVPLTTGIPKSRELNLSSPDEVLRNILEQYSLARNSEATRKRDRSYILGAARGNSDPYENLSVNWGGGNVMNLPLEVYRVDSQGNPDINGGPIASIPPDPHERGGPKRKVSAAMEMHLPTTGQVPFAGDGHRQDPGLKPAYQYPRYLDRADGGVGGINRILPFEEGEDGYLVTLEGDDPNREGKPGAFGILDAASEQYYMAARWPYLGSQTADLIPGDQFIDDYIGLRIMVFNENNGRACIVTPGDWGPATILADPRRGEPGGPEHRVVDIGLSPDAMLWLSDNENTTFLQNLYIGFVDRDYPLGPMMSDNNSDSFSTFVTDSSIIVNPEVSTASGGQLSAGGRQTFEISSPQVLERFLDTYLDDDSFESITWLTQDPDFDFGNGTEQPTEEDLASSENFREWALSYYGGSVDPFINRFGWAFEQVSPIQLVDELTAGDLTEGMPRPTGTYWTDGKGSNIGREVEMLINDPELAIDGDNTSSEKADRIWEEFRRDFAGLQRTKDLFLDPELPNLPGDVILKNQIDWDRAQAEDGYGDDEIENWPPYQIMVAKFMQFMWADPYRRAWLVVVVDGETDWYRAVSESGDEIAAFFELAGSISPAVGPVGAAGPIVGWFAEQGANLFGAAVEAAQGGDENSVEFSNIMPIWALFSSSLVTEEERTTYNSGLGLTGLDESPETTIDFLIKALAIAGDKSQNPLRRTYNRAKSWFDDNVLSVVDTIGTLVSAVLTSYRLQMASMNLNLAQTGAMQIQANIMNKVLNDSIYYDPLIADPIMRLADNAFTREYGEPVIEIREPFQRMHYLSSFNDIISNNIYETTNDVNTVVTATSDGKYPVTVYFDKGAPSHMQKEDGVESGLFWDNARSSGFFSFLHPILHPIETYRGLYKDVTGSTDEMLSKRIARSHLRQNLQDIYDGELTILGNTSIRPHDLVYLSDIYEQMYGMFEVEEVVHHFTPDMGFVSTVKPNALVTVNDPARWAYTNLMRGKFGVKDIRDTVRSTIDLKADSLPRLDRSTFNWDNIHETIMPIVMGNVQYTAGRSAIINDIQSKAYSGYLLYPQQAGVNDLQSGNEGVWDGLLAAAGFVGLPLIGGAAAASVPFGLVGSAVAGSAAQLTVGGSTIRFGNNDAIETGVTNAIATFVPFADFVFDAWDWVQENLQDQQSCYISYLNKNGQPMDAGLAYNQGVAVGHWYSKSILPGLLVSTTRIRNPEGRVRITYDDLLSSLGWNEIDISGVVKRTSWFVDQTNAQVLNLSGFGPDPITVGRPLVAMVKVTEILDGDTFEFEYVGESLEGDNLNADVTELMPSNGQLTLRFSGINTPEMSYYNTNSDYETAYFTPNEAPLGEEAKVYVENRIPEGSILALRLDPSNLYDKFGRLIGVIFHTVPQGTPDADILQTLYNLASQSPIIPWDSYHDDGRPYTLNWELVVKGYADVSLAAMNIGIRDGRDNLPETREG